MATGPSPLPDVSEWLPLQLQLVLFPMASPVGPDRRWWEQVTGRPPTDTNRKAHESTESGDFEGRVLIATADLVKLGWTITPSPVVDDIPELAPNLGPFPAARDQFAEMLRPWLAEHCPPIKRMGFAGILVQRAGDHAAAYRRLGAYLPSVRLDPESYDFMYRINRRKLSEHSGVPGLTLNRLGTWSAAKFRIQVTPEVGGLPPRPVQVGEYGYACVVSIDVNSDAEREEEIQNGALPALFRELVDAATAIALRGDRD
jgi:hypothetical protein